MDSWTVYFSITSGSASGLTGLIFVGLSINLQKIFSITKAHKPGRIFGSLVLLTNILIVSNLCLVPKQPLRYLGVEITLLCCIIWIIISRLDWVVYKSVDSNYKPLYLRNIFFSQACMLPFAIGSIILLSGNSTGFYFLVPGIIFSFIKALVDAWYLIVDINK